MLGQRGRARVLRPASRGEHGPPNPYPHPYAYPYPYPYPYPYAYPYP